MDVNFYFYFAFLFSATITFLIVYNIFNKPIIEANTNPEYKDYSPKGAVPIECKKGSLVIFDGNFTHFSYANTSKN